MFRLTQVLMPSARLSDKPVLFLEVLPFVEDPPLAWMGENSEEGDKIGCYQKLI